MAKKPITMDELMDEVAKAREISQSNKTLRERLEKVQRELTEREREFREWNSITLVGKVSYVNASRFNINGELNYQVEYETKGQIRLGDIVFISGVIFGAKHDDEDNYSRLLNQAHHVKVMLGLNSGITDVTKLMD